MELITFAALMSHIYELEQGGMALYKAWADRFPEQEALFSALSKENGKFEKNLKRTYYSVVTDALDTNFALDGLTTEVDIPSSDAATDVASALSTGIALEQAMIAFYDKAATMSMELMADVPRALKRVVKTRAKRIATMEAA